MSSILGFNISATTIKQIAQIIIKKIKQVIQKEREIQTFIKPHLFSLIQLNGLTLKIVPSGVASCRDLKITTGMAVHIKTNEKKEMESPP